MDLEQSEGSRYGDTVDPPPGVSEEEEDPGCLVDYEESTVTRVLVVCQTDGAAPRCGRFVAALESTERANVYCDDPDPPPWAATLMDDLELDAEDDAAPNGDDYELTFSGETAILRWRGEGEASGPPPGRYSIDELFEHLGEVELH